MSERLILFTRYPIAGQTKTRLISLLGAQSAAGLQRRLTLRALRAAEALHDLRGCDTEIQFEGADRASMEHWLGDRFLFCAQAQGDLGCRMHSAFGKAFREGASAVVLIGADCPELTAEILAEAFERLRDHPVVFGPATDGGYYLVGLRRLIPQLFSGPAWGTSTVLSQSMEILTKVGLKASLLKPLPDIDRPEDLAIWRRIDERESADLSQVSVIIPALNEGEHIARAVAAANSGGPLEVIVVDGGSCDETLPRACQAGAIVLRSAPGRARQMNSGASKARGNVLLFLHADTLLPASYRVGVTRALADEPVVAGAFRFAIGTPFPGRKLVEWTTNFRSHSGQMPYGDQAIFLRRALFEQMGGFADMPILEDYEFIRRLRRLGRIVTLVEPAVTSGRRWQQLGLVRTALINKWMLLGYRLGWPIDQLAATYRNSGKRRVSEPFTTKSCSTSREERG